MVSGKREEAHIIVSNYRFPYLVLGSGPTQSRITLLKEYSKAGTGRSVAACMFCFGFPLLHRCCKSYIPQLRLVLYSCSKNRPLSCWRFFKHPSVQSMRIHGPGSYLPSAILQVQISGRTLSIHLTQSHLVVAILSSILRVS